MRIAAGVVLIILGLWGLLQGGCSVAGGAAAGALADGTSKLASASADLSRQLGGKVDDKALAQATEGLNQAAGMAGNLKIVGIVMLLAGILVLVGGILCLVNKAKGFILAGVALAFIAEILSMVMFTFKLPGNPGMVAAIIKIILLVIGILGAMKVGQAKTQAA